jgi:large subunit ribosomal protein L29
MELKKIREMTEAELNAELKKKKNELFNLRFQHVTGQLDNPIKMRDVKKEIARVKTIMREKELKAQQG